MSTTPASAPPVAQAPESLTLQAARGVRWTTSVMIVVTLLQLAQVAVLARLLPRSDFGLMAMITVVLAFAAAFVDMGLSNAVIQRRDATKDQLSSLYWLNVAAGVCVFVVVVALSPLIAAFYHEPRLTQLVPLAGLIFVITPFGQQFQALLQKDLRFRFLAMVDMCAAGAGAAAAITCAFSGLGVLSLIAGQLTLASVRAAVLCTVGWRFERPRLHFRWRDTRSYVRFGVYQMGEKTVSQLASNLDYLVIGRMLGAAALGPYAMAYQLSVAPVYRINPVLTKVAFPVFALRQHDVAALRRGYARLAGFLVFAVYPFLVGLVVLAPVVVPVVFGDKWQQAIPLVQVLGVMALLRTLSNPSGSIFLAVGRPNIGFWLNLGVVLVAFGGFTIAATYGGTSAVAWVWVAICAVVFCIILGLMRRVIGLKLRDYLAGVRRPLWIVAVMGLILAVAYRALAPSIASPLALLATLVAAGVGVYFATWCLVDRAYLADGLRLLLGRKRRPS